MDIAALDRWLANNLPTDALKDIYPRAMRRLAEHGLFRGEQITRTRDGFLMHTNRVDALKWCVHYFGEWEPGISEVMRQMLRPGDIVIDIGANVGFTSLLAAKLVGPSGRVIAFEPCAATFAELKANIALNGFGNIEAHRVAVSERAGTAELHCWGDNELAQASIAISSGAVRSETVRTISFAEIGVALATVDLIKIDVEGAEESVLFGLLPFLGSYSGALMIEIDPGTDAEALLAPVIALGFEAQAVANRYSTSFYRRHGYVELGPVGTGLQDVLLTRAKHQSLQMPSRLRASHPSRKPSQSSRPQPALRSSG